MFPALCPYLMFLWGSVHLYEESGTRKLRNFQVQFDVGVHTLNKEAVSLPTASHSCFRPFFILPLCFVCIPPPSCPISFLVLLCCMSSVFLPFITWSLSGALSLYLMLFFPSHSLPFCHWQLLADSLALFLSVSPTKSA